MKAFLDRLITLLGSFLAGWGYGVKSEEVQDAEAAKEALGTRLAVEREVGSAYKLGRVPERVRKFYH